MPTKEYLEPEETEQLEKAATCLRDQLLFMLLRRLGCRISEVLALRVEDIDFIHRRITIQHLKAHINLTCPQLVKGIPCGARLSRTSVFCPSCGTRVEKAIKKEQETRRLRQLPIDAETLGVIKIYIDRGAPVDRNGGQFLFNITRQRAWQLFRDYGRRLGFPELINTETGKIHHVSPHKLRDAFAINAVKVDDSGDGIRLLQEHLGHQNINTTMRYRKVAGQEHDDWFAKIMGGKKVNG